MWKGVLAPDVIDWKGKVNRGAFSFPKCQMGKFRAEMGNPGCTTPCNTYPSRM